VDGLAIFGAAKNVVVQDQGGVIRHIILQGSAQAGLEVEPGASTLLLNATVAGNSVGARSLGALEVRNSIITQNSMGLSQSGGGSLKTTYNDLFGNSVAYDGTQAGTGDLAQTVGFSNAGAMDYRLLTAQATTDAGDPADDASPEPAPNGGRVNMGAFGGTALAETSVALAPVAASSSSSGHSCGASASSPSGRGIPWILWSAAVMGLWALFLSRGPRRLRLGSKIPVAILLTLFLLPAEGRPTRIRATTKIWTSNTGVPTNFSTGIWSPAGTPADGDNLVFNSTGSDDCIFDVNKAPGSITVDGSYSGKISRSAIGFTLVVGAGGFTQAGGSFDSSGTPAMSISGNFSLSGGIFIMEGDLSFSGTLWDVTGGTIQSGAGTLTFSSAGQTWQPFAAAKKVDQIWMEDSVPGGAALGWDGGDDWSRWVSSSPTPFSGNLASQSDIQSGSEHQHYFYNATTTLSVAAGDTLFCWVFLDPAHIPTEVMLQWNDGSWEHRAYWGANAIGWGTDGTTSRQSMGALPATGAWIKLSVPAATVGLVGSTLNGMAFTLNGGHATWDLAGVTHSGVDTVWVDNAVPTGASQGSDGGDSWSFITPVGPDPRFPVPGPPQAHESDIQLVGTGEHQHYFYGATNQLSIGTGDTLFAYVYLDLANMPSEVMLQWNDGSWEHRAYWGADLIGWGSSGPSRFNAGALPAGNTWTKLSVPASAVGLEGSRLNGMAFTLAGGRATWDHAGRNGFGGTASYGHVTIASAPASVTIPSGYALTMTGNLTVNGTLTSLGSNISISGNTTVGSAGTFDAAATPVQMNGGLVLNGTLKAPSSALTVKGTFTSGGVSTFTNDGGKVLLLPNGAPVFAPPTQPFQDLILNDTLEGYWKLDTVSGNFVADSSGYGRDGTGMNGVSATPPTIVSGAGNIPPVNFTDPGSLSLAGSPPWVQLTTPPPLASVGAISAATLAILITTCLNAR
jgi:hypothetical protein